LGREAPRSVGEQVDRLVEGLRRILRGNLRGVYLHGSLALGCFNEARSDIDVLVVVDEPLALDTKLLIADLLLHVSCAPRAVELHVLTKGQLDGWRHPSRFEFHYGELHRDAYAYEPVRSIESMAETDADLAAHVTIARNGGIAIVGPSAEDVFPDVPFADYRDALGTDLEWARTVKSALYGILSPCRVWATLATHEVHSKASGARWALDRLPEELKPSVESALASYTGAGEPVAIDELARRRLLDYIEAQLPQ
jgi:streptomycin 3"-adenylyltransferase